MALPVVVGARPAGALRRGHQHPHPRRHDGRRQGAAAGHQPRAGPELREGVRRAVRLRDRSRVRLADLLGRLHPHGRRPDHGPRRRRRPAHAAAPLAGPGTDHAGAGEDGGACGPSPRPTAEGRRCARRMDAARQRVRPPRLDGELKGMPVRIEVGPRELAEGNVTLPAATHRREETVALGGRRP